MDILKDSYELSYSDKHVTTLLEDGLEKCASGITSFEEILKAVDLENDLSTYEADDLKTSFKDIELKNSSNNNLEFIEI